MKKGLILSSYISKIYSLFSNTSGILNKKNKKTPSTSLVSYVTITFFSHGLGGERWVWGGVGKRENEIQICNS